MSERCAVIKKPTPLDVSPPHATLIQKQTLTRGRMVFFSPQIMFTSPIWTPLIPASFDEEHVSEFGENTPNFMVPFSLDGEIHWMSWLLNPNQCAMLKRFSIYLLAAKPRWKRGAITFQCMPTPFTESEALIQRSTNFALSIQFKATCRA